ncbi:PQQ-dependent sugar dehydrogenase [Delftia acidovorans]|uniref:PQQ-dependent sugar dehydrogenase n=1 Tax=Delftia acidovorans TaxID=80866 RepID=A0A7T2S5V0_DELAC|nr:PQQ-dependent sugar dehydrogenase [Delftia acidovorans]QPS09494.1 PQQ-dependent sugar dehydrogenase [Delftia acidovorans]
MPPSLSAAIAISTLGLSAALWAAGSPNLSTEIVADGLEHPWAVAFLPDGRYLVTERPGRMRIVQGDGRLGAPLAGLPAVEAAGQGGLLDVVLDSDFARNRQLYFCYSEPGSGADSSKNSTALASARLSDDASRLEQVKVLFSQRPKYASALHFGCRIVERMVDGKSDGTLFLALGERSRYKEEAQNLKSHLGKIVRIAKDGSVPRDNPFAGRADAWPEIWSYGHRNAQGAALAPDGSLWMHEHGPQGGDEVNRPEAGKNYGWPVITHGENYGGGKIGAGITRKEGMDQPLHYWVPSIAPSGMAFVTSDRYGAQWKGSLVVGSLKFQRLERLTIRSGKVTASEQVLPRLGQRVRDVRQGPDGWLYLLTDAQGGQLLRVTATP